MAYASVTYTSASGTTFALTNSSGDPIPYLRQSDISVTVNGVLKTLTTDYTFNTAGTSIVLNTAVSGVSVVIARVTDIADATVTYTAGSTLTAQDLNNADNQIRYGLQEFSDTYGALTTGTGDLSALAGFIGSSETWTSDNAHTATTGAIDNRVDSKITTNNATVVLRDGSQAMQAALSLGGFKVTNLATPTSNTDASTKAYVDSNVGSVSASATAAAASASAAATSASNASTSASAASASQSAAASSASSASTSASNAATSASSASTSASNASTSATNASTSATSAASSAASALAAFDSFDDRYLGSKASDPTVDNDGDPLNAGDIYFNTTLSVMRVYTGTAWVAAYVPGDAVNISFTPYSTIAATNVQNAVQELTDEKLNLTGGTLTGALVNPLGSAAAPSLTFTGSTNTGLYSPGSGQVAISTNGTGRLFIDSSGRLLAGTSTARSNFFGTTLSSLTQIEGIGGSTARGSLSVINNDVSNNPPYVLLGRSGAATLGSNAAVVSGSRLGTLTFHGADGASFIEAATVAGEVDGTPGSNDMPGRLVFSTTSDNAGSPTERMRIDSSGRVGIGSTGPQAQLDVVSSLGVLRLATVAGQTHILFRDTTNSKEGYLNFNNNELIYFRNGPVEAFRCDNQGRLLVGTSTSTSAAIAGDARLQVVGNSTGNAGILALVRSVTAVNTAVLGQIPFADNVGVFAQIDGVCDGTPGTNDYPGRLVFSTTADGASSPTERMRITNGGSILLGCTTAPNVGAASTSSGFAINGTGSDAWISMKQDNQILGYFRRDGTDGTVFDFRKGNATVGSISVTASATAYNTSSDYRLKENVTAVTDGIARLQQLKPSRFNFKADPDKIVDGFIAHEAQAVVPECVTGTKDEVDADGNPVYQGIDQSKLVPLLTAALQEAIGEIKSLKDRVAALEAS
jgi:hypothetical protein